MRKVIKQRPGARGYDDPNESALKRLFYDYQRNAKRRRYTFSLTENQFRRLTSQTCHYCGCEPKTPLKIRRKNREPKYVNGVDRVDNSMGYEIGNVVTCCRWCNTFKATFDHEVFLKHVVSIFLHQIKRLNFKF